MSIGIVSAVRQVDVDGHCGTGACQYTTAGFAAAEASPVYIKSRHGSTKMARHAARPAAGFTTAVKAMS